MSRCCWDAQLHFPRIYLYGDQQACFECDLDKMYGTIYPKAFPYVTQDDLRAFLVEYEQEGLLFVWNVGSKRFAYFPGVAQGRLLPPSKRYKHYKRATPEPPREELIEYCKKFNILDDSIVGEVPMSYPCAEHEVNMDRTSATHVHVNGTKKENKKENKNIKTGLKSPDPVDNSCMEDDKVAENIDQLREKLGKDYWKNDVHKWALMQIKLKTKAKAILFALMAVDKNRPQNPWGYAETVLQDYNDGKYYKENNVFQDIVEKLKLL